MRNPSSKNQLNHKTFQKKFKSLRLLFGVISRKMKDDHMSAFAAQGTFFLLLSFFPFVTLLLAFTHYLPFSQEDVLIMANAIAPESILSLIEPIVNEIYKQASVSVISISAIIAIWSASKGFMAIRGGLNWVYRCPEYKNYFIVRLISSVYTIMFMIVMIVFLCLFVFGRRILNLEWMGVIFLIIIFWIMFTVLPQRKSKPFDELPGALFSAVAWLIISYGVMMVIGLSGSFAGMYGSLAGIVSIMLWLYACMYCVLLGAEINYLLQRGYLTRLIDVLK